MFRLARLWRTYRLELRLLVWHWSFALLFALYTLLLVSSSYDGYTAQALLLSDFGTGIVPLIGLGTLLFAGLSVGRADRSHMTLIEGTLPMGIEQPFARWLAVMTVTSIFLLPPIVIAFAAGPIDQFLSALPIFLLESWVILGVMSSLVWLLYGWVGNRRWLFPFLVMVWLGLSIGPGILSANFENVIGEAPWLILLSVPMSAYNYALYSDVWGRLLGGNLYTYTTLTYACLLVLLLAIIGLWTLRRRIYRWSLPLVALSLLALMGVVGGAMAYADELHTAYAQRDDITALVTSRAINDFALPADMPYTISDYDITLDMSDAENPTFDVLIELVNRGDAPLERIAVTLNPQMILISVSVPYEQDGPFIYLLPDESLPPQASLLVDMAYSGHIWWYGTVSVGRPNQPTYFLKDAGVKLGCAIAWYPVPGTILVGRENYMADLDNYRSTADCILDELAHFDVTVMGGDNMSWASTLPHSDEKHFVGNAAWVDLLAAHDLVVEEHGDVTFAVPASYADDIREVVDAYYQPALTYLHEFYPEVEALNLWAITGYVYLNSATPSNDGRLTIVTQPRTVSYVDTGPMTAFWFGMRAMMESLYVPDSPFTTVDSLAYNIAYYLEAARRADGDIAILRQFLAEGLPQGESSWRIFMSSTPLDSHLVTAALFDAYQAGGDAVIKDILQAIDADYARFSEVALEDVAAWVRDYGN